MKNKIFFIIVSIMAYKFLSLINLNVKKENSKKPFGIYYKMVKEF